MELTEKEELFLEALFDTENNPDQDPAIAKRMAGYSSGVSAMKILRNIKSRLQDDTSLYFLSIAPRAAAKVKSFMDGNTVPGDEKVLSAALQILDRAGITKEEKQKVEVELPIGVIALPPVNSYASENTDTIESTPASQIGNGEMAAETDI